MIQAPSIVAGSGGRHNVEIFLDVHIELIELLADENGTVRVIR